MSRQHQYLIYHNFPPPTDINSKCIFLPRKGRKSIDGFINQIFDAKIPRITENDNLYAMPSNITKSSIENERLSPCLPPCLLESERMQLVQQWINDIQDENQIRDMTLESEAVQSSSSGTENNSLLTFNNNNNTSVAANRGLYEFVDRDHTTISYLMKPCQPGEQLSSNQVVTISSRFNTEEVQMIIKLFEDYFRRGLCPGLGEVRTRITNSYLHKRRTPQAIRAKIKRLQSYYQVNGLSFIN